MTVAFGHGDLASLVELYASGLLRRGVTRFATRNVEDFADMGFDEVFDPLA